MRPWMKWGLIVFAGSAAIAGVEGAVDRDQPQKPRPVLTKAQHDAFSCQAMRREFDNVSAIEAYHMCGDPGPADTIDPYAQDAPKHRR